MKNDKFMKYLEERLHQWAEWYSRGNFCGLGYPPYSLEYRIMREGTVVRSTGPRSFPANEAAEEIEALVCEMAQHNRNMALALRCHYFSQGGLRTKSRKLNMSHSHYKYYVDMAHQWLSGRMSNMARRPLYF